jgi:two-component system, cell cycle sensor histidine kinase and response regulator CckA
MAYSVSIAYTVANLLLALILFIKSPKNLNSRFYLFCVTILDCVGVLSLTLKHVLPEYSHFLHACLVFCFSLLPFFFLHFVIFFIRRSDIVRSKRIVALLYFAGLFSYAMTLLHFLPEPIAVTNEVTKGAYLFYITWHSILFCVGVAMLYEHAQGFLGRVEKANLLFAGFALLILILPGPFSESIIFGLFRLDLDWYFFLCTAGIIFGVYFIFRYKIVVNTIYDALKSALSAINDIFLITDEKFKIKMARGGLTPLLGYTEKDVIGTDFSDFIEQKGLLEGYREFVSAGKMKEGYFDTDVRKKNGERLPMNFSFTPIYSDNEVSGYVTVGRSVFELRQSEKALRLFSHAVESTSECVVITDLNGNVIHANNAFLEKYEYAKDEIFGASVDIVRSRNNPTDILETIKSRSCSNGWSGELLDVAKGGREFPVRLISSPIYDDKKVCVGCVISTEDITAKRHAEIALQASEAKYRELFENVPVGIFQVSREGRLLAANSTFVRMLGYETADEHFFQQLEREMQASPELREAWKRLRNDGIEIQNMEVNFKALNREGDLHFLQNIHGHRTDDGEVKYYQGTLNDITERKKLQDELLHAQRMESIGTLAGGIAHDFNNILQVILIYAMKLRRDTNDRDANLRILENISNSIYRGASLVKQLMTFARKMEVVFHPVDVNAAIEELRKLIVQTFSPNIETRVNLCAKPPVIFADSVQFHQVLLNLCVNARDAMPDGGIITISTEFISGSMAKKLMKNAGDDQYLLISVTDTGSGMDESIRRRIFEPFFTTKGVGQGTGLGLAVVYGIIENHKGTIAVDSVLGKGSTFRIVLPLHHSKKDDYEFPTDEVTNIAGGTEIILLAEDESDIRDHFKGILESKGYRVLIARDGFEALEIYRANHQSINAVLLDLGLPKISGWQAFRLMKEIDNDIVTIICSGYLDPDKKSEMQEAGIHDFIQKPSSPDDMLRIIREVLNRTK